MKQDILKNYYISFINQRDQQTFLVGLVDYIEYILNDEGGKRIISDIEKIKKALIDEKIKWEDIVAKQVKAMKKADGKEESFSNELSDKLADRVIYSRANPKLLEIERKIKEGREMSVWGAWDKIHFTYSEFKAGSQSKFDVNEFSFCVMRIHNYLLKKIIEKSKSKKEKSKELKFNKDKSVLGIGNLNIKIKKFSNQYRLLFIIFQNKKELFSEWFFSEIGEQMDKTSPYNDKKVYNIVYQLNNKIARDAGIKNFFIMTSQSLIINKDHNFYLSLS